MKKWISDLVKNNLLAYLPYIVAFSASIYHPSDSDMGWHLKYGEYFFKNHAVLRENIFSTMMPRYPWINSSWATDLLTYTVFNSFGFIGLSFLAALVMTVTLYFFAKAEKLNFWQQAFIFPIVLFFEIPLTNVSFRGHLLSLLGISVLYFLYRKFEQGNRKILFLCIPLFILWSNFHGEFILGLALLWGLAFFHIFREIFLVKRKFADVVKSDGKFLIITVVLSAVATLINPFSIGIYQEAIKHFGNPLQKYIVEWLPFDPFSDLWWRLVVFDAIIVFSLNILIKQKKIQVNIPYIVLVLILLALTLSVRRYMWPLILISIPIIKVIFEKFQPKDEKNALRLATVLLMTVYLYIMFIKNPAENIKVMNWDRYCTEWVGCSPKSAEFLQTHKLSGKMFTFYNWGGWLIWKYPDVKPSIDGRMHLWRDDQGYSAFAEYYPIEQNVTDIDATDYDIVYITPKKPVFLRLADLVKMGKWEIVYRDDYAYIFVRKPHPDKNPSQ